MEIISVLVPVTDSSFGDGTTGTYHRFAEVDACPSLLIIYNTYVTISDNDTLIMKSFIYANTNQTTAVQNQSPGDGKQQCVQFC